MLITDKIPCFEEFPILKRWSVFAEVDNFETKFNVPQQVFLANVILLYIEGTVSNAGVQRQSLQLFANNCPFIYEVVTPFAKVHSCLRWEAGWFIANMSPKWNNIYKPMLNFVKQMKVYLKESYEVQG